MDVVFVRPDFQRSDLVPLLNLGADLFQLGTHLGAKDGAPALRRAHDMVELYRDVLFFVNEAAHPRSIKPQQGAGN